MRWPWSRKPTHPVLQRAFGTEHLIPVWSSVGVSSSGAVVSPEGATALSTVAAAIRQPAVLAAGLPLDVYDVSQDRRVRTLSRGKWQNRLLDQPDPMIPGHQFWSDLFSHVDGFGNGYAYKQRAGGRVVELWLLDPERMACEVDERTRERRYVCHKADGSRVEVPSGDLIHVRGWDPTGGVIARSPADRHRDAVGKIQARGDFEARYLQNDARPGVVLKMPQGVTREQAAEFLDLWNARHQGPNNVGKANVIGGGGDIATLPISLKDSQFIEAEAFSVAEVARMYDWAAPLLAGDLGARPFVEVMAWAVRIHLMPRLQRVEAAFGDDPDLFGPGSKFRPYFDVGELMRGDAATMATAYHQLVQVGIMTPNEARVPLGLGLITGGDELQKTPVGGAPNAPSQGPPDGGTTTDPPEEEERGFAVRMDRDKALMRQAMEYANVAHERALEAFREAADRPVVVNVPAPVVNVAPPDVTVNVPPIEIPPAEVTVNVAPADVNVPAPVVTVLPEPERPEVKDVEFLFDPVSGRVVGAKVKERQ